MSDADLPSAGHRRLVLGLLVLAYTFNFIDRTIVASIGQAIKADLKISDMQLGLLGGLYFALLYTLLGIPIARLAERFSRVRIITTAIVVWSCFTGMCGMAGGYASLAAARFGVGIGEAGLSPPAHSLISDYYPPNRRASALSIYSLGVPLGVMVGAVAGGWIAQHSSWRAAFLAVGLPGVAIAAAIGLVVEEAPRGGADPATDRDPVPPPAWTLRTEIDEVWQTVVLLLGRWAPLNMVLGITLVSFAGYGGGQFIQPYWVRTFGLDYAHVGLIVGLVGGGSQLVGVLLGGWLSDRLARSGRAVWYALVPAVGVSLAYVFMVYTYTATSWKVAAVWMAFSGVFSYIYMGPTYGVVQNLVPVARRATATAVLFLCLNLIALGGGPPITGWMIDHLAAFHLARPGAIGLWNSLVGVFGSHGASFQQACPGGSGASNDPVAEAACRSALALGTRQGVLLGYGVGLWGAIHYLLASFGLDAALKRARLEDA